MNALQGIVAFLGRVLLSAFFLWSAVGQMMDYATVEAGFLANLSRWMMLYPAQELVGGMLEGIQDWFSWILLISLGMKLLGSFMCILGWKIRLGGFFLFVVLLFSTLFTHDFWHFDGAQQMVELCLLISNSAILGGLLVVMAFGSGSGKSPTVSKKT